MEPETNNFPGSDPEKDELEEKNKEHEPALQNLVTRFLQVFNHASSICQHSQEILNCTPEQQVQVFRAWRYAFDDAKSETVLPLIYLANDVIQKLIPTTFEQAQVKVIILVLFASALPRVAVKDTTSLPKLQRVLAIWKDRGVIDAKTADLMGQATKGKKVLEDLRLYLVEETLSKYEDPLDSVPVEIHGEEEDEPGGFLEDSRIMRLSEEDLYYIERLQAYVSSLEENNRARVEKRKLREELGKDDTKKLEVLLQKENQAKKTYEQNARDLVSLLSSRLQELSNRLTYSKVCLSLFNSGS